jgi:anti-sigma28 factor (negative regulator of flagellin synthesis)
MNTINGVGSQSPVQKVLQSPIQKSIPAEGALQPARTDKVELSGMAGLLKALKANDIRTDKVAQIKAQIEAGTYEDDHKLDVAADRLLDDLK